MTTIILNKQKLHGDRKIATDHIFLDGAKIDMHPSKKFAVGLSGYIYEEGEVERIMDMILMLLQKHYETGDEQTTVDSCPHQLIFKGIFVLTKDKMFKVEGSMRGNPAGSTTLSLINNNEFKVMGSGEGIAKYLLHEGKKAKEIYPLLSKIDAYTSSYFDTISSKDLIAWGE